MSARPSGFRGHLAPLALAAAALASCGPRDEAGPPAIVYGEDLCATCGMIISDERFAAAVVTEQDGPPHALRFDDIGCMLRFEARTTDRIERRYVHDFRSRGWIEAGTATYLSSPALATPMASGIAACATPGEARHLAATWPGVIQDFSGLRDQGRATAAAGTGG